MSLIIKGSIMPLMCEECPCCDCDFFKDRSRVGMLVDSDVMFDSHLMGDRFFSTREEAEQALKERENDA